MVLALMLSVIAGYNLGFSSKIQPKHYIAIIIIAYILGLIACLLK
jgi:hypothetical protein